MGARGVTAARRRAIALESQAEAVSTEPGKEGDNERHPRQPERQRRNRGGPPERRHPSRLIDAARHLEPLRSRGQQQEAREEAKG